VRNVTQSHTDVGNVSCRVDIADLKTIVCMSFDSIAGGLVVVYLWLVAALQAHHDRLLMESATFEMFE